MYYHGEGTPQNYHQVLIWIKKAAEQGDSKAQVVLGAMYYLGEGLSQDYEKAFYWYNKAVGNIDNLNLINNDVIFHLGEMYFYGRGVLQDYREAFNWFSEAASWGHEEAKSMLQREEFFFFRTNKLVDLVKEGRTNYIVIPSDDEGEWELHFKIEDFWEFFPWSGDGWVLVPLSDTTLLYRQNGLGVYQFLCNDPKAPAKAHDYSKGHGCVNITESWISRVETGRIVSDLNLVQIIINDTIAYIDLTEAQELAEILGLEVRKNKNYYFKKNE